MEIGQSLAKIKSIHRGGSSPYYLNEWIDNQPAIDTQPAFDLFSLIGNLIKISLEKRFLL